MFCRVACIGVVKIPLTLASCSVMYEDLPQCRKTRNEGVVRVMNDVFQIIEDEILPRRGEILKL